MNIPGRRKISTQLTVKAIEQEEAERILAPYLEQLAQAIEHAWERWWELPPEIIKAASTRSRAALVYDFICEEIRMRFGTLREVSVHETQHRMLLLNVEGVLLLRFKKLDHMRLGSNIATQYQTEFNLQLQLPDLPPEAARLVVGYQLDRAQTKITDIVVTYRVGDEVVWHFSARKGGAAGSATPVPLPFPSVPVVSAKKPRITAKKAGSTIKRRGQGTNEETDTAPSEERKTSDL